MYSSIILIYLFTLSQLDIIQLFSLLFEVDSEFQIICFIISKQS